MPLSKHISCFWKRGGVPPITQQGCFGHNCPNVMCLSGKFRPKSISFVRSFVSKKRYANGPDRNAFLIQVFGQYALEFWRWMFHDQFPPSISTSERKANGWNLDDATLRWFWGQLLMSVQTTFFALKHRTFWLYFGTFLRTGIFHLVTCAQNTLAGR